MNALKREFIDLAKRSGWSQAEIARRLKMTRGGINGIITGPRDPSEALLKLFRMVLAEDNAILFTPVRYSDAPERVVGMEGADLREVFQKLEDIHRNEPQDFKTLREVIVTYHKKKTKAKATTNLTAAEQQAESSMSGAASAAGLSKASPPSPATAGTSVRKHARGNGIGKRSSQPPVSPKEVPK